MVNDGDVVCMDKITIRGNIPSKANCYKIITIAGHGSLAKTQAVKDYEDAFYYQCPIRDKNIDRPFRLTADVYFKSNQPDLDNAFKLLLDCLQFCHVIKNDRLCLEIQARKLIDKEDPRIEFTLEELI